MSSSPVRRGVLSASALSLSLALLATACGGSGNGGEAKPSAPAATGKTDAAVAGLLVNQGDLPDHRFLDFSLAEAGSADSRTSDKPECAVLVQIQTSMPPGTPTGAARSSVVGPTRSAATAVTLGSYAGKGAEEAFAAVETASRACAGGYVAGQGRDTLRITKVSAGAQVAAGDEALTLTFEAEGGHALPTVVFLRKGDTVAAFSTAGDGDTVEQAKPVVDAQVENLD